MGIDPLLLFSLMIECPWLVNTHIFTIEHLRGCIHDRKITRPHIITIYAEVAMVTDKKQAVKSPLSFLTVLHKL